jgi:hypothetical protein
MFDDARQKIANELRDASTIRVFLAQPEYLSWTEFRPLSRELLAERLEMSGASVSRALTDLHNCDIIARKGRGPVTQWKLSLKWGWRGGAAAYHAAVRDAEGARLATSEPPCPQHLLSAQDRNVTRRAK